MDTELERRLFDSRVVLIDGHVDTNKASSVVLKLLQLSAASDTDEIQLFIGSVSGNYLDVLAIYDTVRSLPNPVSATGIGAVSNYAAVLLAGCTKGSRSCLRHCRFTIEQPYGMLRAGTNQQTEIVIAANEVAVERDRMEQLLAYHTGRSVEQIHADTEFGIELNAVQAKDYGIIDFIVGDQE